MLRNWENDCILGSIISNRLDEMERNQVWLAKKCKITKAGINAIIKGRAVPSCRILWAISNILDIEPAILLSCFESEETQNDMDFGKRSC